MMGGNRAFLLKGAMTYGLSLGIYWVVKYLFFMLGVYSSFFNTLYLMLTALVPFVAYRKTRRYRHDIGGRIGFFHAWQFGVLLYFFAALVVSLEHFIFYRYIAPPGLLTDTMQQAMGLLKSLNVDKQVLDSVATMRMDPIHITIQGIFNNVFYGILFSLPVALAVSRNAGTDALPPPQGHTNENN
jgi:hypothetical protein